MSRFALIFLLVFPAIGCTGIPGVVRDRAIVDTSTLPLDEIQGAADNETAVESKSNSSAKTPPRDSVETAWSSDELLVGSAVRSEVATQLAAIAQHWDPLFATEIPPSDLETPSEKAQPLIASTIFQLKPLPEPPEAADHDGIVDSRSSEALPNQPPNAGEAESCAPPKTSPKESEPIPVSVTSLPAVRSAYISTEVRSGSTPGEPLNEPESVSPSADASALEESPKRPLDQLISQIQSANSLRLNRVCLCRQVNGFGQIVEFSDSAFDAGEPILIYCEVDNFKSMPESQVTGMNHRTSLSGSYLVLDRSGAVVAEREYSTVDDISQSERADFFLVFPAEIPELQPGAYRMYLVVHDELGQALASQNEPIQFQIAADEPAAR